MKSLKQAVVVLSLAAATGCSSGGEGRIVGFVVDGQSGQRMNFFKADDVSQSMFQVKKIIEPPCNDVQDYHNDDRPAADKNILMNWDRLRVRLGGRDYLLRPGDDKGYVVATLTAVPDQ